MIVECKECEARVDAETLKSYEYFDPETGPPGRYSFLRCQSCQSPFLVLQENYGNGWDEPYQLYPAQDTRVNPGLPAPIQSAYGEALACLKAKAFTAAAIMCRKTLEGVCAEHGVSARTLVKGLKEMKERGVIETRLFEWADALRIAGNEAAHDINMEVSKEDARDMIEFTNALLEYVFTFRNRFEQFKKRREKSTPS
jgi:hypothetical protein